MNSNPLVTIVTPCFNGRRFLREAIESVLSQDYPHIEYLVVDGGSTDGTIELLKTYGERIRWISEPDKGQSDALNKGFRMASGEILAWINSDDLLLPGAVSRAVEAFAKDPGLGMVYGEGLILEEDGATRCRFPYTEPFDLWRLIHYWDSILQQSVFLNAKAVEAVGGIDESLHWGLDWDLFIRLGKRFPVKRLEAEMGAIRDHPAAKTPRGGLRRWFELAAVSRRHSGRVITPASIIFGLDAYHKAVSGIGSASASRAAGLLRRGLLLVHGIAAHWLWPYLHDSQGWFEDGWASRTVRLAFPRFAEKACLEIEGLLPPTAASGQTVDVVVNGHVVARRQLPAGRFRLSEALPRRLDSVEFTRVELRASKVIERRLSPRGRTRRLCYQLDEVRLATPARKFACTPPRVSG